jgi:CheY-like chemotaxis protein
MAKRVLLCDDEIHIIKAAEFKLVRSGIEVECASDGQAGWEAIQRRRPDLLVTDCQMPRMNGIELVEAIRSVPELLDLPILMLTGKGFELPRDDLMGRLGVRNVIGKPFSPRDLQEQIMNILAETPQEAVAAP